MSWAGDIEGIDIFGTKKDCEDFLGRLQDLCEKEDLSIYAWAPMDTHFHVLARTGKDFLSDSFNSRIPGWFFNNFLIFGARFRYQIKD